MSKISAVEKDLMRDGSITNLDICQRYYSTNPQKIIATLRKKHGCDAITDEWQKFKSFNEWALGNGYDKNAQRGDCTIDRIDVNGDYCPENCRWINIEEQCKNKRNSRIYTYNNETLCLKDWADKLKMNYPTLQGRLKKGWSFEDAITIPIRKCSRITKAEEE